MSQSPLLPRSTPAGEGVDSAGLMALLDRWDEQALECHSVVVLRHGQVIAEGWWTPYSADRPHLLYSLTKSFTAIAVGLVVDDGLLALDDRVVDVLPEHVPEPVPPRSAELTVHHLLSMSTGHTHDLLEDAWDLEPNDLVRGFLRIEPSDPVGSRHQYNNATTFLLARMVERVAGRTLPDLVHERLFAPMGVTVAEWEHVAGGATFGFHGLHLTTEAVAAFGEVLLRGGRWHDRQLVSRQWIDVATRRHIETVLSDDDSRTADWLQGYGYQFWMSRHGFRGDGAMGQLCLVVPSADLVVAITAAVTDVQAVLDGVWDCLLPAIDQPVDHALDSKLGERMGGLALPLLIGEHRPQHSAIAVVDGPTEDAALPLGSRLSLEAVPDGWSVRLEADGTTFAVEVGHGEWRESRPFGRPVVASGGWQGGVFVADLYVITTPSRVRITVADGRATAAWNLVPLVGASLLWQLSPDLITRPNRS